VLARYGNLRQVQEVTAQSSYYSVNDRRLHFGLGEQTAVDLSIRWPSGVVEEYTRPPVNRVVTIREGAGIVK
jgi:enediyne biosynthesis protein E4